MPVIRISASVDWSMNSGAALWIGERRLVMTGPRSSTGSPITLRVRPSVSGPTGIMIGLPVSTTSAPRTSPSVVSIATVRTVFSPRCCATSSTRVRAALSTCSADRIDGRSPSNRTSTTAPMIWVIVPTLLWVVLAAIPQSFSFSVIASAAKQSASRNDGPWNLRSKTLERFGTGDDLDQLLRDDGLARAVIIHRQTIDHLAGIARRVVHRGHPRTLFAGRVFEQCGVDLYREIVRQQLGQDFLFARLEFVDRAAERLDRAFRAGRCRRRGKRDQLLRGHDLRHRRAELVENDRADVKLASLVERENASGDVARLVERHTAAADIGQAVMDQTAVIAAQTVAPLAPDRQQ